MNTIVISILTDIVITILFIWNLEKLKDIYSVYVEKREAFLESMYLFIQFLWYLLLTFTYLYVILNYIISDEVEKDNLNILVVKLSIVAYIVEHIMMK
jgi:hypothetical protein